MALIFDDSTLSYEIGYVAGSMTTTMLISGVAGNVLIGVGNLLEMQRSGIFRETYIQQGGKGLKALGGALAWPMNTTASHIYMGVRMGDRVLKKDTDAPVSEMADHEDIHVDNGNNSQELVNSSGDHLDSEEEAKVVSVSPIRLEFLEFVKKLPQKIRTKVRSSKISENDLLYEYYSKHDPDTRVKMAEILEETIANVCSVADIITLLDDRLKQWEEVSSQENIQEGQTYNGTTTPAVVRRRHNQ